MAVADRGRREAVNEAEEEAEPGNSSLNPKQKS